VPVCGVGSVHATGEREREREREKKREREEWNLGGRQRAREREGGRERPFQNVKEFVERTEVGERVMLLPMLHPKVIRLGMPWGLSTDDIQFVLCWHQR